MSDSTTDHPPLSAVAAAVPRQPVTRSVVEQVTDQLIELVVSGRLQPGQALPINELAAALGVSHIPVREALRRLESEGLINYQRGKGAQVAPVSIEDIKQIFDLRAAIEPAVAARSVAVISEQTLELARRHLDEFEKALKSGAGHPAAASPAHQQFHYALLPGASQWDHRILDQLYRATERYNQLYRAYSRLEMSALDDDIDAHERLFAGAQQGGSAYVSAVVEHVEWSHSCIVPLVRAHG